MYVPSVCDPRNREVNDVSENLAISFAANSHAPSVHGPVLDMLAIISAVATVPFSVELGAPSMKQNPYSSNIDTASCSPSSPNRDWKVTVVRSLLGMFSAFQIVLGTLSIFDVWVHLGARVCNNHCNEYFDAWPSFPKNQQLTRLNFVSRYVLNYILI